jgi:biotin carboxylase
MERAVVLFVNTRPSRVEAEPCFRAAHALGLDVALLADAPVAVPAGAYAEHVAVDTYDTPALVSAAEAVARRRRVVGVVCWGDRDVEGTAHVARALGLPGHPVTAAAAARNKGVFRDRLADVVPDLTVPHLRLSDDAVPDVERAVREVGFPAVLKPAGASASKGIFRVHDPRGLVSATAQMKTYTRPEVDPIFRFYPGEALLEAYIDGTEHSVEALLHEGEIVAAAVTDKWVDPVHSLEYRQVHPSALTPDRIEQAVDAAARTAAALGLGTGAIHLELRMLADRGVRVLELNARTGGGYITTHLIPLARGYDFIAATLRLACGLEPMPAAMPEPFAVAGSHKLIAQRAGRFEGLQGVDGVLATPGVVGLALERAMGAPVLLPPAGYTECAIASVIAVGYDRDATIATLDTASGALTATITEASTCGR